MDSDNPKSAVEIKEEGNKYFKAGDYEAALSSYAAALKLYSGDEKDKEKQKEKAVIYKNRAACQLKLEKYEAAIKDATKALDIVPNDPKALFRRSQAFEATGRLEEAFKDARTLSHLEPKNTTIQATLRRLGPQLHEKSERVRTTDGLVDEMFGALFGKGDTEERQAKALKNLVILSRDEPGAQRIFQGGNGLVHITSLVRSNSHDQKIAGLKILKGLCTNSAPRSMAVLQQTTLALLSELVESSVLEISKAATAALEQALVSLSHMPTLEDDLRAWRKKGESGQPPFEIVNKAENKAVLTSFINAIRSEKICPEGRDECIDALVKVFPKNKLLILMFVNMKGVKELLHVAATSAPLIDSGIQSLTVTERTRMHISVLLSTIWDSYGHDDKQKEPFRNDCEAVIGEYMKKSSVQSHLEGCTALCALMQGAQDSAAPILKSGILPLVINLGTMEQRVCKIVSAETLALGTSDKVLCSTLGDEGLVALRALYQLRDDEVRVRALVGLCKLGTTGGGAVNDQTFADGATLKLYKSARSYLTKPKKEIESRKWAAEALSFLSMDADVKEQFIGDAQALNALLDLTKNQEDSTLLYGVCQTFVNLTNTFDLPEIPEEMKKLGEFAQVKMPKLAEKDGKEYVDKRIDVLIKAGCISSLVNLTSSASLTSREMISRVFLGIVTNEANRGVTVQQGGVKALLSLADNNTEVGKDKAVQALAKIAITMNPEIAFPGHKSFGLIRPLVKMLHPSKRGLLQYEALMALTNLAQLNDDVRKRIVKEKGIPDIEMLMFDQDEDLKRASTECMCNMILCEEVFKLYEKVDSPTERVKLLTVYSGEEDFGLQRAASGGLAMLTASEIVCNQVAKVGCWLDIMKEMLLSNKNEIKHRGAHVVANMMAANKDIATKLVESEVLEILMVLSRDTSSEMEKIRACAMRALDKAVEWELIKPTDK
ncbi:protein unc-45 homolog A isoform X3 [Nematostella vectensis]|uniref:protein unc-45 homolog A isoform X3 n=1 Tax=Nematostella vectensis TaxID=45351 RepID=UPI002077122C|nr:protein unc-45 homolog A isoform X3 [Nematostella vectensis]